MHAVMNKAWADLRGRLWQSVLIALSVAGAAGLLYLGLAGLSVASSPYEKQMARANGAHAVFNLKGDAAGRAAAERIAARPEVAAHALRQGAHSYLVAPDSEKIPYMAVIALPPGPVPLMGYVLIEGEHLGPDDRDAALLPVSVGRHLGVRPGDVVRLQTQEGPRQLRVAGLIADPIACTFPRCGGQPLYLVPETFARLPFPADDQGLILGVRLHDPNGADAFASRIRTAETGSVVGASSWLVLLDHYRSDRLFNGVPILLFSLVAVLAAAMILATIIGGTVLGQFREIAILKSLGFTGGQVLLLYLGQTVLLSLVGGALGVLGGHLLAIRAMGPLATTMGTPDVLRFMPAVASGVMAVVLVMAVLFTGLAAWRAIALRPAAMLAEGFTAPRSRMGLSVRLLAAMRLPATALLGVKDAMARPGRAAMTIFSLTICLLTITLGMNFPGMATQVMENREQIGINWDMIVQPGLATLREAEDAVRAVEGVEGYYRETFRRVTMVDKEFNLSLRTVDGDWSHFGFRLLEGRLPQRPDEILLAPRAWERLGVAAGDQLRMQIGATTLPVTVVGKYQDAMDGGRIALAPLAIRDLFPLDGTEPSFLRVKLRPDADWMAVRKSLLARTDYRLLVNLEDRELPDFAREGVTMMRVLGWVMAAIAALSIMGASLLTAREQMREVGIRKAIGMTPAQVLASAAAGGAWYGLIALCLALPGAYLLQMGITSAMAAAMGLGSIDLALPGSILALAAGAGMLLAVGATLPAAGWGARLAIARVLHAE